MRLAPYLFATLLPLATLTAAEVQRWTLEHPEKIGGHSAQVLGAPRAFRDATGPALVFDGAHDGLILPVNPIADLKAFTIELRIRPSAKGPPEQRFFHIQDTAGARALLELRLTPDGRWALDTFLTDGTHKLTLLDRTLLHSSDVWHWVALHYDGHHMTAYVDGQKELTGEVIFAPTRPTGQTSLGVRLNHVYWYQGAISEVRIHPTALPAAQLAR